MDDDGKWRVKDWIAYLFGEISFAVIGFIIIMSWIVLFPLLFWNKNYWAWYKSMMKAFIGGDE